jgi:ribosome-associated toxin RatA of RatAB toxin-antitoxin module
MTYEPIVQRHVMHPRTTRERDRSVHRDDPFRLGPMPESRPMTTRDIGYARVPVRAMFDLVRAVERWPTHLSHYRSVRMLERDPQGGGVVEMTADRPFGLFRWPTWWRSIMEVDHARPAVRFRHVAGLTTGMEVEWAFDAESDASRAADGIEGTRVTLLHLWSGWKVPLVGPLVAMTVIGPVFVHGIASRTIAGLVRAAEARA